jgi:PKD repeat protein
LVALPNKRVSKMFFRALFIMALSLSAFAFQHSHQHTHDHATHTHQHLCECDLPPHLFARKSAATADVVITEIMQNPSAVADSAGEWFEVFNPGSIDLNLQGWTIRDEGSDSHTISGTLIVPALGYAVLGRNADSATNGGIAVDYQYSGITLGNGADELVLERADSSTADIVRWDGGTSWPDPTGASMELNDANNDNNVGSNWATASDAIGNGDSGTPGTGPNAGNVSAAVVISEVMQNPAAVADGDGEWFELYNAGGSVINLNGWTIRDQGTDSFTISTDVMVPAGSFAILGRNGTSATNGGVNVDYVYGTAMWLSNTDDELVVVRPDGTIADEIAYTSSSPWVAPDGASMELTDLAADNALGQNWALATTSLSGGDFGTPGSGPGSTPGGGNAAPVVNAGGDQSIIYEGATLQVQLDATVSDADNDPLTYDWTLVAGTAGNVTIISPATEDTQVNIAALGVYTFRLTANDGTAAVADDINITVREPASAGSYNVYFGNLHAHSSYSDGNKSNDPNTAGAAVAFRYARDQGGLDYLLISDHNHGSAGMARIDYQSGVIEANTVNAESPNFTALYGMEWGTISTGGHVIMASDTLWGWEAGNYDVFVAKGDYNALFNQINSANTFGQLCHPSSDQFSGIFTSPYNAVLDEAVSVVTVVSGPAFAQATDFSEPASSTYISRYNDLLLKGYHIGPAGDQDTHYANWGLANEQRTAVLATENTRAGIMEALDAGRTYAVTDRNIVVSFTATQGGTDYAMASRLNANVGENIALSVSVSDPDGEATNSIALKTGTVNGSSVTTQTSSSGSFLSYNFSGTTSNTKHFFYAEITQADGQRAWTAPIWIEVGNGTNPPVNQAPTAGFTFAATDLQVNFSDQSSDSDGSIASYSWDFGDGSTSTSSNPNHTYAAAGTYTVTLTVSDNDGAQNTASQQVSVATTPVNQSPTASFIFAASDLQVNFSDQSSDSDGSIANYSWNFGDGAFATSSNPIHTYAAAGTYTVTLTVTDNNGAQDTASQQVSVTAPTGGDISETFTDTALGNGFVEYTIEITNGGVIDLSCSWSRNRRDLDLFLYGPAGNEVARAFTTANPETLTYNTNGLNGTYTLIVDNATGRNTPYTLQVDVTTSSQKTARSTNLSVEPVSGR